MCVNCTENISREGSHLGDLEFDSHRGEGAILSTEILFHSGCDKKLGGMHSKGTPRRSGYCLREHMWLGWPVWSHKIHMQPAPLPWWPRYRSGRRGNPDQGQRTRISAQMERPRTRKTHQFRNGVTCDCRGLTCSTSISCVEGHERESSLLFRGTLLIIFWCGYMSEIFCAKGTIRNTCWIDIQQNKTHSLQL
jgi:hypothetical protein